MNKIYQVYLVWFFFSTFLLPLFSRTDFQTWSLTSFHLKISSSLFFTSRTNVVIWTKTVLTASRNSLTPVLTFPPAPEDTWPTVTTCLRPTCHLRGCFLSYNGCLSSSPFTAGFGSDTKTTHAMLDVSLSQVCPRPQTDRVLHQCHPWLKPFGSRWGRHQHRCFTDFEKQQRAGKTKRVFFFVLLRLTHLIWLSGSHSSLWCSGCTGCDYVGSRPVQRSVFSSCLCLSTCILGRFLKNVVQRSQRCSFYSLTQHRTLQWQTTRNIQSGTKRLTSDTLLTGFPTNRSQQWTGVRTIYSIYVGHNRLHCGS